MEEGEIMLSDHLLLPIADSSSNIQASLPVDSFLDDFLLNSKTCTHTHTCNPPGPDAAHTHTCYHTHTHVIQSEEDKSPASEPRRPLGNRVAVRKYREKKKAHTAYLEEEVKKLRHTNQVLMGKMKRQAILETEVSRLKSLLVQLGGKIDDEVGDFPFQKHCNSMDSLTEGECGAQLDTLACNLAGSSGPSNVVSRCGNTRRSNCQPANFLEEGDHS